MSARSTRISHATLRPYATLRAQVVGADGPDAERRYQEGLEKLQRESAFARRVHVATLGDDPCALVALAAAPLSGTLWKAIFEWSTLDAHRSHVLRHAAGLMRNWLEDLEGQSQRASSLLLRLDLDRALDGLEEMLKSAGWERGEERYEFKTPVDELPTSWEGPLLWRELSEVGFEETARVIDEAGRGPEWEQEDRGSALLRSYLEDGERRGERTGVEVGFLPEEEDAVAFVVAQTAPSSGWCTIQFMGVTPKARGRGLGPWVHRRGFELMRRQGGALYHGGTSAKNKPMLKLFEEHACEPHAHLAEWMFRFDEIS